MGVLRGAHRAIRSRAGRRRRSSRNRFSRESVSILMPVMADGWLEPVAARVALCRDQLLAEDDRAPARECSPTNTAPRAIIQRSDGATSRLHSARLRQQLSDLPKLVGLAAGPTLLIRHTLWRATGRPTLPLRRGRVRTIRIDEYPVRLSHTRHGM